MVKKMNVQTCFEKLKESKVLSFATVDLSGNPQIRCVSAVHYETDYLYFFTAKGKAFCEELLSNSNVQILAHTEKNEMIRLSGNAYPAPENKQQKFIETIFSELPFMNEIYPGNTKKAGIIFCIKDAKIEYFNLDSKPIWREFFTMGNAKLSFKGYRISENCTGCKKCIKVCPQNCIKEGKPFTILQNNCLHCGACFEACSNNAVEKIN